MTKRKSPYQRVLLKLSGEALMGGLDYGIEPKVIKRIAASPVPEWIALPAITWECSLLS